MILVDTSVLIGYLNGHRDSKSLLFKEILTREIPFGISAYTYQEVLQKAKTYEKYNPGNKERVIND